MKKFEGKEALPFVSGSIHGGEINVRCPSCGYDYTHIRHVGTLVGRDKNEAETAYEGTIPTGTTPSRRSAVEIVFNCEKCVSIFALVIQQHKGVNFIEIHADVPNLKEV